MNVLYEFCKGAESITGSTKTVESLENLKINIDIAKDEVRRTRFERSGSSIFNFELKLKEESIKTQINYMQTIELFYPDTFSWRFNGENIECIAMIPMKKEYLGIFGRFRGIFNFIKQLRTRLTEVLKMRQYYEIQNPAFVEYYIISTGSLNAKSQQYCVDIKHTDSYYEIVVASNIGEIRDITLKELNMKYWVKEINPDYNRTKLEKDEKKYPLSDDIFSKYPIAIRNIAALPKKGNYNRFLLGSYLFSVHNERDAKHQLDTMLSDDEREHINNGNCKGQWRNIVVKKYPPPSCKTMLETGFAKSLEDCYGIGMIWNEVKE